MIFIWQPLWARVQTNSAHWHTAAQHAPPSRNQKPAPRPGYGSFECDGCVPDPVLGARFVRDIYEQSGDTTGAARGGLLVCWAWLGMWLFVCLLLLRLRAQPAHHKPPQTPTNAPPTHPTNQPTNPPTPPANKLTTPTAPGKYSVPVLYDKQRKTIVNNESSEIVRQLNSVRRPPAGWQGPPPWPAWLCWNPPRARRL